MRLTLNLPPVFEQAKDLPERAFHDLITQDHGLKESWAEWIARATGTRPAEAAHS